MSEEGREKKLCKKGALRASVLIFRWLEEHPLCTKNDAIEELGLEEYLHQCPLCEYSRVRREDEEMDCEKCPGKEVWESYPLLREGVGRFCMRHDTPFHKWCYAVDRIFHGKELKEWAKEIAERFEGVLREGVECECEGERERERERES